MTVKILKPVDIEKFSQKAIAAFNQTGLPHAFKVQNSATNCEILMYDVIGSDQCNEKTFADALLAADGKDITIRLSSPGGSVFEGWSMFNQLKDYKGNSTVVVDGVCASIASIFALAAKNVQTQQNSLWMTHNSWLVTVGNANELRKTATTLDKVDSNIKRVLASKTGKSEEDWANMLAEETWFTSDEALAIGLVDSICPEPKKKMATLKSQNRALEALSLVINAQTAPTEPADPADDNVDASGLIDAAIVLLQEATELLVPEQIDSTAADKLTLAKEVRVRQAMIASMGLQIEQDAINKVI